ncbi:MAG TPA: P-loop NTPase [Gemmatimonadota bacterium]|nr:P-loop NTPase [Gemmatimonadota bacterium]
MSGGSERRRIRTYHEVADPGAESVVGQVVEQRRRLRERLAGVGRLVAVGSGKGGVGKSAISANVAAALAASGRAVGALDADLDGPSLARMLGARGGLARGDSGFRPARGAAGVGVVSMDLLVAEGAPVRWRGPEEHRFAWQSVIETGALREFLSDVEWGALDVLVLDLPPGTEKLARLIDLVGSPDAVLIVTTPSEAARHVVAKSARFLEDAGVREVGLVANMATWSCPHCGVAEPLFAADGARRLARDSGLELWAEVPFDPRIAADTDEGMPIVLSAPERPAARSLAALAERVAAP